MTAQEDALLAVSQMQRDGLANVTTKFHEARCKMIARENPTWRLANTYEANPALAYEVVTGSPKWFDDTSDEEVETLSGNAEDMAVEAIRNGEGGQRIRELVAAGMAFAWILASRHEARMAAEDTGCSAPAPYTQREFI